MTFWNVLIISLAQINLRQCHKKKTLFAISKDILVSSYCNILEVTVFFEEVFSL